MDLTDRIDALDWDDLTAQLDERGFAVTAPLLDRRRVPRRSPSCSTAARFRSTIDMARHRFGDGRYRYFDHPLPDTDRGGCAAAFYAHLAPVANAWAERMRGDEPTLPARRTRSCSSAAARPARSARRR